MIEPLAVAYYSVKKSGYKQGQTALIVGGGPVCFSSRHIST